jgi:hypothetical protein
MKNSRYSEQQDFYAFIRRRRQRSFLFLYSSFVLITSSLLIFIFRETIGKAINLSEAIVNIVSIFALIISVGIILNFYLSNSSIRFSRFWEDKEPEDVNSLLNHHLKKTFIEKFGYPSRTYYDEKERETENTKENLFINDIEEIKLKFLSQFTYDIKYAKAFEDLYSLEQKIKNQITRLISNSNLNLILGTLTTLIGVIILGVSIFQKNPFLTSLELLSHYIPRVSTVILIEIFAFFFLRLYKKNLDEIKYFQNELSNLSFKISSLKSSLILEDKESASKIIGEFSKVERNFILKKNETTEKLEIEKLESQNSSNALEKLSNLISSIKKHT